MNLLDFIIGVAVGIATNLFAWWILFHKIVPKLSFSDHISKTPAPKTKGEKSGYKYRIKVENSGTRTAIDTEFLARVRIKGISKFKNNWHIVNIPLSSEGKGYRIPRLLPTKIRSPRRHTIKLLINETSDFQTNPIYLKDFRNKARQGTLLLEDVLSLGSRAALQIFAFGYDEFSGTRKLFVSKEYTLDAVKEGPFDIKGLSVNESPMNKKDQKVEDDLEADDIY